MPAAAAGITLRFTCCGKVLARVRWTPDGQIQQAASDRSGGRTAEEVEYDNGTEILRKIRMSCRACGSQTVVSQALVRRLGLVMARADYAPGVLDLDVRSLPTRRDL